MDEFLMKAERGVDPAYGSVSVCAGTIEDARETLDCCIIVVLCDIPIL
jgi:hypothetical protein